MEEEELEDVECMAKIPYLVFVNEKEDGGEEGVQLVIEESAKNKRQKRSTSEKTQNVKSVEKHTNGFVFSKA